MSEVDVLNIEFDPEALRLALAEKNLTQDELNRLAGYPQPNTVNKIINKNRKATATDLLRISAVLEKSPTEFVKN